MLSLEIFIFINGIKSELLALTFQSQKGCFIFLMGNEGFHFIFLTRDWENNNKKHFHSVEIEKCYSINSNYLFLKGKQGKKTVEIIL